VVDAGDGAFGRDPERDVVLDRLLDRVARPAGEDLAARGTVGAEQLTTALPGPRLVARRE